MKDFICFFNVSGDKYYYLCTECSNKYSKATEWKDTRLPKELRRTFTLSSRKRPNIFHTDTGIFFYFQMITNARIGGLRFLSVYDNYVYIFGFV